MKVKGLMAVNEGIDKWKGILNGELILEKGRQACHLCGEFRDIFLNDDGCGDCPLVKVGHGCMRHPSAWKEYDKNVGYKGNSFLFELEGEEHRVVKKNVESVLENLQKAKAWIEGRSNNAEGEV